MGTGRCLRLGESESTRRLLAGLLMCCGLNVRRGSDLCRSCCTGGFVVAGAEGGKECKPNVCAVNSLTHGAGSNRMMIARRTVPSLGYLVTMILDDCVTLTCCSNRIAFSVGIMQRLCAGLGTDQILSLLTKSLLSMLIKSLLSAYQVLSLLARYCLLTRYCLC